MAEEVNFSQETWAARDVFPDVITELESAGAAILQDEHYLLPETADNNPLLHWYARFDNGDGHVGVILTIVNKEQPWGITLKRSLCGKSAGVCYHHVDQPMLDEDKDWLGLDASILKARTLAAEVNTNA